MRKIIAAAATALVLVAGVPAQADSGLCDRYPNGKFLDTGASGLGWVFCYGDNRGCDPLSHLIMPSRVSAAKEFLDDAAFLLRTPHEVSCYRVRAFGN